MAEFQDIIGLVAVSGTFVSICVGIICFTLYSMLKVVRETSLKRRLVEAGFTATEIEMVLSAGIKAPVEKPFVGKNVPPKAAVYT